MDVHTKKASEEGEGSSRPTSKKKAESGLRRGEKRLVASASNAAARNGKRDDLISRLRGGPKKRGKIRRQLADLQKIREGERGKSTSACDRNIETQGKAAKNNKGPGNIKRTENGRSEKSNTTNEPSARRDADRGESRGSLSASMRNIHVKTLEARGRRRVEISRKPTAPHAELARLKRDPRGGKARRTRREEEDKQQKKLERKKNLLELTSQEKKERISFDSGHMAGALVRNERD